MYLVMFLKNLFMFLEELISGSIPFFCLITAGLFLSFKSKFLQLRGLSSSFSLTKKAFSNRKSEKEGISSFQAASTALSATVGTGNIVGVAGAISLGGAGALFWMWIAAFLGMIVKYAEITLGVLYRDPKKLLGGPMYYIKNAMPAPFKFFGTIFSAVCLLSVFSSGNITQVNAAVTSFSDNFHVNLILGLIFCFLSAVCLFGGLKRIAAVTEKLVPLMSLVYIMLCLVIIISRFEALPKVFSIIFKGAFSPESVTGGVLGSVSKTAFIGASRGVFSNEAGLGTSAIAHASAFDADSKTQGLFGIFEVFLDTLVICSLTGLTILVSGVKINYGEDLSSILTVNAFSVTFGTFSQILISAMLCIFSFSSVIGWAFYGETALRFLFKGKFINIFKVLYPLFCVIGAVCETSVAWRISAFFNGMMLIINLASIIFLNDNVFKKREIMYDKEKD